ncbi:hypothetical protein AHMF7616_01710 [Adhaeribacter pallidiroseus]|uniref:Uncharacterized protein n=1 Tax=Adhaeribacter pallidiroseus TaxID=2072847 RepID=A0A369QFN5_9BACT|nr:hypothetical protein AHMF7616_01710 [Adhaeribacter pallidiroseus]
MLLPGNPWKSFSGFKNALKRKILRAALKSNQQDFHF